MTDLKSLKNRAAETFRVLAGQAGLDAAQYECTAHWLKSDVNRTHIVLRFDSYGGDRVILKQAFAPHDPEEFASILTALDEAHRALTDQDTLTVPRILAVDPDAMAYLMTFLPGETLLDLCRTHQDHRPYLEQAGRWLSAYHAGTFQRTREFQPKFMARHMLHLADQVQTGARKIKGRKRFCELAAHIGDYVEGASGHSGKIASKHGDLNAHNILISDDQVAAYDFLAHSRAPVGYDIARLLLSYAQMVADLDSLPNGHVVPPDAMAAFFKGYTFVAADDPTVAFLLRIRILSDWNRLDPKMNAQTVIRFERLRLIARRAFA